METRVLQVIDIRDFKKKNQSMRSNYSMYPKLNALTKSPFEHC
jgi:hypothetical protein